MEQTERAAWLTVVLGGTAVGLLLGLHLLPGAGGVDPVRELLSEYPLRSVGAGVSFVIAMLSASVAIALLGVAMARHGLLRGWLPTALLVVWCVSLVGLTVFLKDPVGSAGTWYGMAHKVFTVANFASLPALCALLWWRFRVVARWRAHARVVGVLACASVACALPFAAMFLLRSGDVRATGTLLGLVERGVVAIDVAVVATLLGWTRAKAAEGSGPQARTEVVNGY